MAKLGTPENPEIIDPTAPPRPAPKTSRFQLAGQIFTGLVSVCLPALFIDAIFIWLWHTAVNFGGVLTWLALVILLLPALLLTLVAMLASLVLIPVLFMVLSGRLKSFSLTGDPRMRRFVNLGRFGRPTP